MDKVKVKLLTQHDHAGQVRNRGDVIELDPETANWLIELGKAEKYMTAMPNRARDKRGIDE